MKATLLVCAVLAFLAAPAAVAQVKITPAEDHIAIEIAGQPFGDLLFGPNVWKPYLWPLRSASGKIVVRHFPMVKDVPGETHDHNHQRGLWFGHGEVNGYDFWAPDPLNRPNPKFGRISLVKVVSTKSGKDAGSLTVIFDWKDPAGKVLLTENRTMTFRADPKLRIVDVDLTLTAKDKVVFGDTKEGTFGLRLAAPLQEEKGTGHMVNAQGAEGEKAVWGKPSDWVDYFGTLDGEQLGIAIFDHPQNPRHPVRWHARGYGLFAANPFGLGAFTGDKSENGALTIEPGQKLRFRYRVVIHAGDVNSAHIGDLYKEWAK